jgi:hypothetical protein
LSSVVEAAPDTVGESASPLTRVRQIGYALFGLKLAAFGVWSVDLYQHFALTSDFAHYEQAWYLIAHGNLNPYDTIGHFSFWQNHSEFIMWPLALLYWVFPNGVLLLWLQDAAVVGAELVAFLWLCEIARRYRPGPDARWLAGAGLVLLLVNPWSWWSVSFDFHAESLAVLFAVLFARDLVTGRRRAWAWAVPLLACGDVAATYVFGLGLGAAIISRTPTARARGAVAACLGAAALALITVIHGNKGSPLQAYDYLADPGYFGVLSLPGLIGGLATHPVAVLGRLWAQRLDLWANLGSSGLVGVASPMLLPLLLVVVIPNSLLPGTLFSEPLFQSLPVYVFLPVGTVGVLGWLTRRHRRAGLVLAALVTALAVGWSVTWTPRTLGQWLRMPGPTAATLAAVSARIPESAAVFVSQGVVGRFAGRTDVRPLTANASLPVQPGQDWFVLVPWDGVETQDTQDAMALAGELVSLHATLVTDANDVWAFRWDPPPGTRSLPAPAADSPLPAWTAPGAAGSSVLTGPPAAWHVTSIGDGYVADRLVWQEPAGRYLASVRLSSAGLISVQVWANGDDTLIARRLISATHGIQTVTVPVDVGNGAQAAAAYDGSGLFQAAFTPPPGGQPIEIRIAAFGDATVNVYSAQLVKDG